MRCSLEVLGALAENPAVRLAPHLDRVLPAVLTAIVHAQGAGNPWREQGHWAVRRAAAVLLARLIDSHSGSHPGLGPRACAVLCRVLPGPGAAPVAGNGAGGVEKGGERGKAGGLQAGMDDGSDAGEDKDTKDRE